MRERDLIQLTLSPEEACWLYAAANTGHLLAAARGARVAGNEQDRAKLLEMANKQFEEIFVHGDNINPQQVIDRLQKLLENVTRAVYFSGA